MAKEIYHIYDKIFKKILTLSTKSVIRLINGLFETNYPPDSTITYNWTEFEDKELRKVLADTILTINGIHSYHVEAQITEDKEIVFRMFEYGYGHANRTRVAAEDGMYLCFPEPKIIYLYSEREIPPEVVLHLDFGMQGQFDFRVGTVTFLNLSPEELDERGMIILIPFSLLKLRKMIQKERSPENLEALKKLIQNDIIGSIERNRETGNISGEDAQKLKNYTHKLYEHIYSHYDEMEEVNDMTDESLILDVDIIIKEVTEQVTQQITEQVTQQVTQQITEQVTEQVTQQITEQVTEQVTQEVTEQVTQEVTEQVTQQITEQVTEQVTQKITREKKAEMEQKLQEKDAEIQALKQQLEALQRAKA